MLRDELLARIAFQQRTIETWSSAADRPAQIETTARSHTGFAWFDIAMCRLLLGEAPAAGQAFARAAESTYSALEIASSLATYSAALEAAVLSGDRALASRFAAQAVEPEERPSLVGDRLAWALALPSLLSGDDGRARAHAEAASAVPERRAWYPGLGDAIGALAAGDSPGLTVALERVLGKHVRYARSKSSWCYNAAPCLLCVPAAVLLRLAGRRGLTIGALRGRRASVPLALVHSVQPYGEAVSIEADFVPAALTAP